ncbi:MAG: sigma-70 family RNA polymerase sigma factor [Phycisphaerae bacterium]|nr:sigma-70 family RNA polymerase sigma factor [Phycisphaerae bacterium]
MMQPATMGSRFKATMPHQCGADQRENCAQCPLAGSAMPCANYQAIIAQCLGRIRRWQVPPNWSKPQWLEESQAQAQAEVVVALATGSAAAVNAGTPQLASRILNSVLKRYRQEWSFARHCGHTMSFEPGTANREALEDSPALCPLEEALACLPESDRALMKALYWDRRSEAQAATDLGVSQQAVSKRKRRVLARLAVILRNLE